MEYRIKRISDDELMHYGVLGMKWGVRRYQNEDGSLTAAGKKKYIMSDKAQKAIAKDVQKYLNRDTSYGNERRMIKKNKVLKGLHDSQRLTKARDELRKLGEIAKDYAESEDVQYEYKIKALAKWYDEGDEATLKQKYPKDDIWLMYEDWDQGSTSSFALYLKDKGTDYNTYSDNTLKALKQYQSECEKTVKQLLDTYGDEKVKRRYSWEDPTVKGAVADGLKELAEYENLSYYAWY